MVYDYRHELIELLNHTSSDENSLLQTQRSLTLILDLLNQLQPASSVANNEPKSTPTTPLLARKQPTYRIRHGINKHPLTKAIQPATVTQPATPKPLKEPTKPSNQAYLKQAITTPETTTPAEDETPTVSEAELLARDNCYPVHRLLSGAEINHQYYPESILHRLSFPINDGDVVQLDYQRLIHGKFPTITRVTNDHLPINTTPTQVIEYATLEPVAGSDVLQIKATIKGNSILDESHANTIVIDPYKYPNLNLKAGTVIDFAYYDHGNGMRDAKAGEIRWVYPEHEFDTAKAPRKIKQVKKVKQTRHEYEDKLDYDLKQKKVLVISGARDKTPALKAVVTKHHGVFYTLDTSMENNISSSKLKRAVKDVDLVVICIDQIHHRISQLTTHHAKRNEKPFAIANTSSNTAVERAIFRALNGDHAYESSSQDLAKYISAD